MLSKSVVIALSLALLAPSATLAADVTAGSLSIQRPWTRATPPGAKVAGGFMTITNTGKEADKLIGGSVPFAGRTEVHEMSMDGGIMKMRELAGGLEIKPGQSVVLKPGSFHVMFMDLNHADRARRPAQGHAEVREGRQREGHLRRRQARRQVARRQGHCRRRQGRAKGWPPWPPLASCAISA